jgi:hypothetical protein
MIWGKTDKEVAARNKKRREKRAKELEPRVIFVWFPKVLYDGRWVWLEYVERVSYVNTPSIPQDAWRHITFSGLVFCYRPLKKDNHFEVQA